VTASFFLALILLISLDTVVSAQEKTEITVYPGQTITNNKLWAENAGWTTLYDVRAVASGEAADWVSPTTIYFGTISVGQRITKTYTIRVPEDAVVGRDYILTWEYYSEEGSEGSVHMTIHVTSQFFLFTIPLQIWIIIILVLVVIPIIVVGVVIGITSRRRARKKPITRICPQCGRTLPPAVKFCPYCGKTLGE